MWSLPELAFSGDAAAVVEAASRRRGEVETVEAGVVRPGSTDADDVLDVAAHDAPYREALVGAGVPRVAPDEEEASAGARSIT